MTRRARKAHEKAITEKIQTNPKSFWSYAQSQIKARTGIPSLLKNSDTGEMAESNQDKAEILADFFSSVFTREPTLTTSASSVQTEGSLTSVLITPQIVAKYLNKLKPFKSPGPDGMHPREFKELSEVLSPPLSIIYNTSMKTSTVPEEWKNSFICAIYKKGDKSLPCNYRRISLTRLGQAFAVYFWPG